MSKTQRICKGTVNATGLHCKNKVSEKFNNEYCEKHGVQSLKNPNPCKSRRKCPGVKFGKAVLPDDKFTHCEGCRKNASKKSNKTRKERTDKNEECIASGSNTRICYKCPANDNKHHVDDMGVTKNGDESNKCNFHFIMQQMIEENRNRDPKDREEYHKMYESLPETKMLRKKYREDNPDKVYIYYTSYRARQLNENPDEYRKRNAETHKLWCKNHPDEVRKMRLVYQTEIIPAYKVYMGRAESAGYKFDLDQHTFADLVSSECYFCNSFDEKYLTGIDRLNNESGYVKGNVVPCCTMCNMMKNTLNEATFILMCAHIATYHDQFISDLYPTVFNDYRSANYITYKNRANKREIEFLLTASEFNELRCEKCYICGKEPDDYHRNGIDRIYNDIGYIFDNCASCCGNCNFLKRNYDALDMIDQCGFIAIIHGERLDELFDNWTQSGFHQKNQNKIKLTVKEKKEKNRKLKEDRHNKTMKSKTPVAMKKRAAELKRNNATKLNKGSKSNKSTKLNKGGKRNRATKSKKPTYEMDVIDI